MKSADIKKVTFLDGFWSEYRNLVKEVIIPYQWEALNDNIPEAEPSHAIHNFKAAAGLIEGEHRGFMFQDSDLYKWLEAVGYSLSTDPNAELERQADEVIALIEKAQQPDGYVDTYYIIKEPGKRFTNIMECHELYCLGHLIEAAVAYYEATGKRSLLDVAIRFTDLVADCFGVEEGKLRAYPGHQVIELALMKLRDVTGDSKYSRLAEFFIKERGQRPSFFVAEWEKRGKVGFWNPHDHRPPNLPYFQAHVPVLEQKVAVGHAVRAVYMYAGMADVALDLGADGDELKAACDELWSNIVDKQMYITGGIGQTYQGEAFTFDYDLPNDTIYAETCASIGLVFFAQRMFALSKERQYFDVIERALYNGILSGMSRDGKSFFYVNPLEVLPEASEKDPGKQHVKHVRQKWFGCSCCPPNLARLLASLGKYSYSTEGDCGFVHLYGAGAARLDLDCGEVEVTQETEYPWNGAVKVTVNGGGKAFSLAFRIPGWCREAKATVNGEAVDLCGAENGYLYIRRQWEDGAIVMLEFPMPVEVIEANPLVSANAGKVAIQRGPIVYCAEEKDNGKNISALSLTDTQSFTVSQGVGELKNAVVIKGNGARRISQNTSLYYPLEREVEAVPILFVPYYLWGNRGAGEMSVWIRLS